MKTLYRFSLGLVFLASMALVGSLLRAPKNKEEWVALTGILAVIAAVIGALPALRVLEIQEDVLRPRPTPYFDLTSRYHLLQLRVKNLGGGAAYDVRLHWKSQPVDPKGDKITSLDYIPVLLPQDSVSVLVGPSTQVVKDFSRSSFEGECSYKDASGKNLRQKFVCSVGASQKQLVYDNELPKTLRDLQEVPKELARIAALLEKIQDPSAVPEKNQAGLPEMGD